MSEKQFRADIIGVLLDRGQSSPAEIAAVLCADLCRVKSGLKVLVEMGHVTRRVCPKTGVRHGVPKPSRPSVQSSCVPPTRADAPRPEKRPASVQIEVVKVRPRLGPMR